MKRQSIVTITDMNKSNSLSMPSQIKYLNIKRQDGPQQGDSRIWISLQFFISLFMLLQVKHTDKLLYNCWHPSQCIYMPMSETRNIIMMQIGKMSNKILSKSIIYFE